MDFREFATNYLNPFFLFYRFVLVCYSVSLLFFSLPLFASSASGDDLLKVFMISSVMAVVFYVLLRNRSFLLYFVCPLVLFISGFMIRVENEPNNILIAPMALWWTAALLVGFNSLRSWGYGISLNDIAKNMSNRLS